jgi:thioredoxin-like negative regulator of GroEL
MVSLLLAIVMGSVTPASIKTDYAEAYEESVTKDQPLMVVVSAPWCPACNVLKESTLEPMAATGELDNVSVAVLNRDRNPELANRLTKGERMLPQIILFSRDEDGKWQRKRLTGYQPQQPVRNLIRSAARLGRG